MGVKYAATLGSTAETLSAIKAAQLWRQGMLAGRKPTRHISQSVRVLLLHYSCHSISACLTW